MSVERAVNIVLQICDALTDAHQRGVVHRDVKPSNILLTDSDFAYLVDFGIATTGTADTALTATGTTVGTFGYMAPERFDGTTVDARSDIYSLGCVLHELLTGSRPFAEHNSAPSLIRAHLMLEPTAPSAAGVAVPPGLDQIPMRAMAKDPDRRFSSIQDFADAVRTVKGVAVEPATPVSQVTSFARPIPAPRQSLIETRFGAEPSGAATGPIHLLQGKPPRNRATVALAAALTVALLTAGVLAGALVFKHGDGTSSQASPIGGQAGSAPIPSLLSPPQTQQSSPNYGSPTSEASPAATSYTYDVTGNYDASFFSYTDSGGDSIATYQQPGDPAQHPLPWSKTVTPEPNGRLNSIGASSSSNRGDAWITCTVKDDQGRVLGTDTVRGAYGQCWASNRGTI